MKIHTSRFGEINVDEDQVITMTEPLLGFPDLYKYVMRDHSDDTPFKWLQSLEDSGLAFVILDPALFKPDYGVRLSRSDVEHLQLESDKDAQVYTIVVVPPNDPQKMTANLQAPLVLNTKNNIAKQVVLNDPNYPIKYPVFGE
ncbi:flagellar assembly protein FliW [Desulfurispira natronophila]|uniref:Flagellar assembly factor FliW n=1 Tax=Desulfurispira natronophila TaxID=682562 RepID=A0A7W7Y4P4_9BACT|nr:flagellar assembly protein FliW [Desulfurispira natronophila]MBB5021979.1 flagellar assembly factor FliW [Desulfurispira natronophila]